MKHKRVGKLGFMAMKLDMSKAYDRVEWNFLCRLMAKMGFEDRWIQLIYGYISSISYSILVNGEPHGDIKPTRGLRHGNPLSPYLFLLVSEGLNGLIEQAVGVGDVRGFSLCCNGPQISHLFFADDTLLFCRVELREIQTIQNMLRKYELASGQKINQGKTTLFFGRSVSPVSRNAIKNLLGVPEIKEFEHYLGLPAMVGKNRRASLNYIKERVWGKLQGWKEKLLSQAGREVLLKVVVQAIPTFAMSCFKLLVGLCNDIEAMIRKF